MRSYSIVLVEDNAEEAHALMAHLERYGVEHDVRFAITHLPSALEFVATHPAADLIFMDIDLPGIDGMEAAEELRLHDETTPLVFVTNLAQYAVRGYQVDALDFIVKPVRYFDLAMRMSRAMRVLERNRGQTLTISSADEVHVVPLRDILYVDLIKHDLQYHLEREVLRRRGSLKSVAQELPATLFVKLSQGCIANMSHVRTIRGDSVELDDGTRLYFSRSRRKPCLEKLSRFLGGTI